MKLLMCVCWQSASLYRYLEKRDFVAAFEIACLGVTDSDWQYAPSSPHLPLPTIPVIANVAFDVPQPTCQRSAQVAEP